MAEHLEEMIPEVGRILGNIAMVIQYFNAIRLIHPPREVTFLRVH
jgi:hypothetical protein